MTAGHRKLLTYTTEKIAITLDKKVLKPGDYVIAKVTYNSIGSLNDGHRLQYDTVDLSGIIKLKIRNTTFTAEDFAISPKIKKFKSLESIGLGRTSIMRLPEEMTSLPKLKEIYTNDTMKYIPKPLLKYLQNDYFIEK